METIREDGYKEFQGKDLDAAIEDACQYFNAGRERLEIEILQDARSGIFGIVGARKARIRARRARLNDAVRSVLGSLATPHRKSERTAHTAKSRAAARDGSRGDEPHPARRRAAKAGAVTRDVQARSVTSGSVPGADKENLSGRHHPDEDIPHVLALAREILTRLLTPLMPRTPGDAAARAAALPALELSWQDGGVLAKCGDRADSGSVPDWDGSLLSAIQHLASRLLSHRLKTAVSIRLDMRGCSARQEEELTRLATSLADKVCQTGRALSTRPLNADQRRIVHTVLKSRDDVQARSTGQGTLKRVLIQKKVTEQVSTKGTRP